MNLYIRQIDDGLVARVKAKATLSRKTLKDVVSELFEGYAADMPGCQDLNAAHCPVSGPIIQKGKVKQDETPSR